MNYTDEQNKAIGSQAQNILLYAGAGTGKTTALVGAVNAHKLDKRLVITFTNKAAQELKKRIVHNDGVTIGTFHGIAWSLLKNKDFMIIDDHKQKDILKFLFPYYNKIGELHKEISLSKCLLLETWDERQKYDSYCTDKRFIDFGQIIITATELLEKADYDRIYIDEFQDTDPAQLAFLLKIKDLSQANLFCVGDPRQSIYGWRGGDDKCFDVIKKRGECQEYELTINFRSPQKIVDLANSVTFKKRLQPLLSNKKDDGIVEIFHHPQDSKFIAAQCRESIMSNRNETIAVLFRTNAVIRKYEYDCIHYCIPYSVWGGMKITDYNIVKDFIAWLIVANLKHDRAALIRAALTVNGIGPKMADTFPIIDDLAIISKKLNKSKKDCLLIYFYDFYHKIKTLDFIHQCREVIIFLNKDKIKNPHLEEILAIAQNYNNVKDFLNSVLLENNNEQKNNTVILSTVHKSKGLEFDTVFIPHAHGEYYPHKMGDLAEENNVFYVAVTRAKKNLYITTDLDNNFTPFLSEKYINKS